MTDQIPIAIVIKEEDENIVQNALLACKEIQGKTLVMNINKMYDFLEKSTYSRLLRAPTPREELIVKKYKEKLLKIKNDYYEFIMDVIKDDLLSIQQRDTLLRSFLLLR
jgi:hypothetical protein